MEQHGDKDVHRTDTPVRRPLALPLLIWFTIVGLVILGTIAFFFLLREYTRSSARVDEPIFADPTQRPPVALRP